MSDANYEFGHASSMRPDAVGPPGQRRFRLLIESSAGSACLWLEKEQLYALALAIHRVLAEHEGSGESQAVPPDAEPTSSSAAVEFKVSNLALGRSSDTDLVSVQAYDEESADDSTPAIRWWGAPDDLRELADDSLRLCAAGRPRCPLCHAPLDQPSHVCPRTNGHSSLELEEE